MVLTARDKAILEDLRRFRVMSRDDIALLHFQGLKNPQYAANNVLLRLYREGLVQRSTAFVPYIYYSSKTNIKKNSAKINHFLAIVEVYKEMKQLGELGMFQVEPKYGSKGTVEPDIFCIYKRTPFFIEVQRSVYSERQMNEKLNRYLDIYNHSLLDGEPWQPENKKIFPRVLILSEHRYRVDGYPFKVIQAQSFTYFLQSLKPKEVQQSQISIQSNLKLKVN